MWQASKNYFKDPRSAQCGVGSSEGFVGVIRIRHSKFRTLIGRCLLYIVLISLVCGCAAWPRALGDRPCCITTKPKIKSHPIAWHLFDVSVIAPIKRSFHLIRLTRRLFGVPVRSINIEKDQVSDSAFFTNRDPASLSAEAVRWGPSSPEDRGKPPYTLTRLKGEGKTLGFFVSDSDGKRFLFKLDPVDAPELLTGAEAVTSKLMYALGYNVPSYEIVYVRPQDLLLGKEMLMQSPDGSQKGFSRENLDALIEDRLRNGKLRVVASKIVEGDILGRASFKQFRDCADVRALKVAYAWVNNIDAKDHNSLLVWNGEETVGYIFDFGTSLGADAGRAGPKDSCAGWLYVVDLAEMSLDLLTLGLHKSGCDVGEESISPSVGLLSKRLDPDKWKPYAPNLAFKEMNDQDARWMASRINTISVEQLRAAISAGQYSDHNDANYIFEALQTRREAIVERYLSDQISAMVVDESDVFSSISKVSTKVSEHQPHIGPVHSGDIR